MGLYKSLVMNFGLCNALATFQTFMDKQFKDLIATVLRSGGLKVRLAQGKCVGEFKGKGGGRVFGNDQR